MIDVTLAQQPDAQPVEVWHLDAIPLIGFDQLDLKDAQAAALISVLADIVEAACVLPAAVPTTHAAAA